MCEDCFRKLVYYDDFMMILGFPKFLSYDNFMIYLGQI